VSRVAVVGLGYWGPNLARNFDELGALAALCDLDESLRERFAARHPAVTMYADFEELLADESIDGVVIATPVPTHYALAKRALEAGKHALVEKPLAGSLPEAVALAALAEERQLVLMPGHTFLYSPPVQMIGELIASGELGDVYFISTSRVNLGLHQSDASVFWDLGPHDFSILSYWLGASPTFATATGRGCVMPGTPDVAFINLEYGSGVIAHVELAWLAPSKLRRTTLVGSKKMVVYDDTSLEPVRIFDSGVTIPDPDSFGEFRLTYRTGDIVSPRIASSEPLSLELADFCRAVRTGSTPRSSTGVGIDVVSVIEAVERSYAEGGVRTPVASAHPEPTAR
jgi:predicted dehydrogenase